MIRFVDAATLAYTKLRTHRVRTGITVAVAGMLFGLIAAVIIIAQGVFDSVDRFSDEGLNSRTVVTIARMPQDFGFNEYDHIDDKVFVSEVETNYKAMVAKKQAAAKKYAIYYDAAMQDPSPVGIDPVTKQKVITDSGLRSSTVQDAANARRFATYVPFDVEEYVKPYSSATVLGENATLQPSDGALVFMKGGKEGLRQDEASRRNQMYQQSNDTPALSVLEASLTKPFVSNANFDTSKGTIPAIFPYSTAEKLLGYKPLAKGASTSEKLSRLSEVRSRIGEVSVSYCYRNQASQALVSNAVSQEAELKRNIANKDYVKPNLIYTVPEESGCGAVGISADTRTAAEKKQDANQILFDKEIGVYVGEPAQHKVTIQGVGMASDMGSGPESGVSVSSMVQGLLGSWLSYGSLVIPEDMLQQVPAEYRPEAVFTRKPLNSKSETMAYFTSGSYLVEFGDKSQARALMQKTGMVLGGNGMGDTFVAPFGSGVLVVDELRVMFEKILMWVFLIVGTVAIIILGSMIGRTVAEGRRESAVFRAIGAKRSDIGVIYGMYALLLSFRAVIFAAVLAIVIALTVEILFWHDATLGARLAYAASDTTREFHLFSLSSVYLLVIVGVILVAGLIASIIPILLGARRSPIKDMRDDT